MTAGRWSRAGTGWSPPRRARGRPGRSSCAACSASRTRSRWGWPVRCTTTGRGPSTSTRAARTRCSASTSCATPTSAASPGTTRASPCRRSSTCRPGSVVTNDFPMITHDLFFEWSEHHRADAPDLWPDGRPRRDGRGDGAGLHRGQQRRLPLRLRRDAALVRRGVRPPLRHPRLARGAPHPTPLPDGRRRSPRPTCGCSPRWRASTRSTTATSSATATSSPRCRRCGATRATCSRRRRSATTTDFDQIKQHYYRVQDDINPSGIVPKGPDTSGWLTPHGREALSDA